MFVLSELKNSVKLLEGTVKALDKIDNLTDLDSFEPKLQKIVFNLQMQANQVAGEIVPQIIKRRQDLQHGNAQAVLANIRALKAELAQKVKEKEDAINDDNDTTSDTVDSGNSELESNLQSDGQDGDLGTEHENSSDQNGTEGGTADLSVPEEPETSKEETKVEDGGDGDRQREPNTGNRKPKSPEKTK